MDPEKKMKKVNGAALQGPARAAGSSFKSSVSGARVCSALLYETNKRGAAKVQPNQRQRQQSLREGICGGREHCRHDCGAHHHPSPQAEHLLACHNPRLPQQHLYHWDLHTALNTCHASAVLRTALKTCRHRPYCPQH